MLLQLEIEDQLLKVNIEQLALILFPHNAHDLISRHFFCVDLILYHELLNLSISDLF